jgi:hypothetical protein
VENLTRPQIGSTVFISLSFFKLNSMANYAIAKLGDPMPRARKRSFDLHKWISDAKIVAFDIGMFIIFLVALYRFVVHEIWAR